MKWDDFTVKQALKLAIEKLEIYRAQLDGTYRGGMEHSMLIDLLETKIKDKIP